MAYWKSTIKTRGTELHGTTYRTEGELSKYRIYHNSIYPARRPTGAEPSADLSGTGWSRLGRCFQMGALADIFPYAYMHLNILDSLISQLPRLMTLWITFP